MKKRNRDLFIFLCATAVVLGCFFLAYMPRKTIPDGEKRIQNFAVYRDTSSRASFFDVAENPDLFTEHDRSTFFTGRTKDAVWLRFSLAPADDPEECRYLWIRNASLENITVFYPGAEPVLAGKKQPVSSLKVQARDWYIPVPDSVTASDSIYLRVETATIMWIPLQAVSSSKMIKQIVNEYLFFGVFFGIILAILCVNAFSFLVVKNFNFLCYATYLSSLLLYQLRVHGFLYLIPMPFAVLEAILWISLGCLGIFLMLFAKSFLSLAKRMPITNTILNTCIALFIAQTVIGIFFSSYWANQIAYITGFIVPLIILIAVIKIYFSGHYEFRFYLVAWAAMISGTTIWSTAAYIESRIPANYFFTVGTAINSLLFTLAIFDMIKMELNEKELVVERENYYRNLSRSDPLTGLYNRRYLSELINRLESDGEMPTGSALIMIDLDNFKMVNDTHGHLAGDMILTKTGTHIKKHIRKTDIACRYGGDEFLVFLPGANETAARSIAESMRNDILADFTYSETGEEIKITVSIGVSENRLDDSFDGLFLRADAALYQAKKLGRNRISVL